MAERKFKYSAKIKQPQSVAGVKINPAGGEFTERQYRAVQKDAYGKSLLEKGLLVMVSATLPRDSIPDFDSENGKE